MKQFVHLVLPDKLLNDIVKNLPSDTCMYEMKPGSSETAYWHIGLRIANYPNIFASSNVKYQLMHDTVCFNLTPESLLEASACWRIRRFAYSAVPTAPSVTNGTRNFKFPLFRPMRKC